MTASPLKGDRHASAPSHPPARPLFRPANRANAGKSTGPRTREGKARVALNALQHGGYAVSLRENLAGMGDRDAEWRYLQIQAQVSRTYGVRTEASWQWFEQVTRQARCLGQEKLRREPLRRKKDYLGVLTNEPTI